MLAEIVACTARLVVSH